MPKQIKVGNICKCQHGKVGLVTKIVDNGKTVKYIGQIMGGKGKTWQSKQPIFLAKTLNEYWRKFVKVG